MNFNNSFKILCKLYSILKSSLFVNKKDELSSYQHKVFLYTQTGNHTQRIRSNCYRRLHSHSQLTGTRQYLFRGKHSLFLNHYQQNSAICWHMLSDSSCGLPSSQYWPVHPSIQSHRKLPFWFIQLLPSGQGESAHSSKSG